MSEREDPPTPAGGLSKIPVPVLTGEQRRRLIDKLREVQRSQQAEPPLILDATEYTDEEAAKFKVMNKPLTDAEKDMMLRVKLAGERRPLGVDWSPEDVAKCLAVFWNLGLTNPDDPGQKMEQDGATITLLDSAGKPQRFRLVREFPEIGSDS